MTVIMNQTGTDLRIEAYDANKQLMMQNDPVIPSGKGRYVNQEHVGSASSFFVLAFYNSEAFNAPPGIGVNQGSLGGGVEIMGCGGSIEVTNAYSQPSAAAQVGLHDQWTVVLNNGQLQFQQGGSYSGDTSVLMGW
jgi:hypothetical protein